MTETEQDAYMVIGNFRVVERLPFFSKIIYLYNRFKRMEDKNESGGCCGCGCGCLYILISLVILMFCITWCVKSCKCGSLWEGGVETVKEYYNTADTIWNKKGEVK